MLLILYIGNFLITIIFIWQKALKNVVGYGIITIKSCVRLLAFETSAEKYFYGIFILWLSIESGNI